MKFVKYKFIPKNLYKKIFTYIPRFCVDIVIKDKKRGVLLVKRNIEPYKGYWHLPGGLIRYGERIENAAKRKAFEETGLIIKIKKFIKIYDDPKIDPRGHVIIIVYLAYPIGGKLKVNKKENSDARFFQRLPRNLGFITKEIIKDSLKVEK
jgi:8-oxo-dGTP diphosphatase